MKSLGKLITAALFAACAAAALAQYSSPELLMVTDVGGTLANGTVLPAQVERYDPYTGAYLGAFGAGYFEGTPSGITVIGQDAYVTDIFTHGSKFSRIDKFNFSTGAYDGSVFNYGPYQLTSTSTYGGNLIVGDYGPGTGNGYIDTLSPTGNELSYVSLPTNIVTKGATVVGSQLWVATTNVSTGIGTGMLVYTLNLDGTINTTSGPTSVGTPGGGYTSVVTTSVNGTQWVYAGGYNAALTNGLIDRWTTGETPQGEQLIAGSPNGAHSLAAGHNGLIYAFDSSNKKVVRYDGGDSFTFGPLGSFALSDTANGNNIAVYAAPEPVSMAFLGLGVVGLIARRRRS